MRAGRIRHRTGRKSRGQGMNFVWRPRRYALYLRDDWRCAYCGAEIAPGFTLDHLRPESLGGADANENLVTCCRPCNSSRKGMSVRRFLRWLREVRGVDTFGIAARLRANTRRPIDMAAGRRIEDLRRRYRIRDVARLRVLYEALTDGGGRIVLTCAHAGA